MPLKSGGQAGTTRAEAPRFVRACPSAFHVAAGDEARAAGHRERDERAWCNTSMDGSNPFGPGENPGALATVTVKPPL